MFSINYERYLEFENTRIIVLKLDADAESLVKQFDKFEIYTLEYSKIVSEKRKLEFLGVRLALNQLIGKEVQISYDKTGKPFLADNSFQISISHSGKWIALIIDPELSVGIDIECPNKKIEKLSNRFLSKIEQEELIEEKKFEQLLVLWSAKETLYKIIGKDAVDFANQLRISQLPMNNTEGDFSGIHVNTSKTYNLSYIQSPDYTLVYCKI